MIFIHFIKQRLIDWRMIPTCFIDQRTIDWRLISHNSFYQSKNVPLKNDLYPFPRPKIDRLKNDFYPFHQSKIDWLKNDYHLFHREITIDWSMVTIHFINQKMISHYSLHRTKKNRLKIDFFPFHRSKINQRRIFPKSFNKQRMLGGW